MTACAKAQDLLEKPPIVCTLTKHGTAVSTRSMPITMPCAANGDHNGPTVFATHSTHLLNALSQASYIHVREGRGAINSFNPVHDACHHLPAVCHAHPTTWRCR
ncbi:Biodegradative arginine decarboxylase [Escherichia coli]|nr:Biodegradative arginine decarboxylase [Escherichia coli]